MKQPEGSSRPRGAPRPSAAGSAGSAGSPGPAGSAGSWSRQESDTTTVLTALADPTRRRLLDVLAAYGGATATRAAEVLPVSRQALVKHLAVLDRAGLVESRREGRDVRYTVRPDALQAAASGLLSLAAEWDRRLAAIKRIAEGE